MTMESKDMKALFGARLKNARVMRGLSLDMLANKMG